MEIIPDTKIGQHFLTDKNLLNFLASLPNKNRPIVEIGAGDGRLTELLAVKAKQLYAVEIDGRYFPALRRLEQKNRNLKVIFQDFLNFEISRTNIIGKTKIDLIGSLPYHIVEPLFYKIINWPLDSAYFVIGTRLLNEIQAKNNSDDFGKLTFYLNTSFNFEILQGIPKEAFDPIPPTSAAIVKFTFKKSLDYKNSLSLSISKSLISSGSKGTKTKNVLKEAIIKFFNRQNIPCTQNEARSEINKLKISEVILEKSYEQLSNKDVQILHSQLINCKISPSSKT